MNSPSELLPMQTHLRRALRKRDDLFWRLIMDNAKQHLKDCRAADKATGRDSVLNPPSDSGNLPDQPPQGAT